MARLTICKKRSRHSPPIGTRASTVCRFCIREAQTHLATTRRAGLNFTPNHSTLPPPTTYPSNILSTFLSISTLLREANCRGCMVDIKAVRAEMRRQSKSPWSSSLTCSCFSTRMMWRKDGEGELYLVSVPPDFPDDSTYPKTNRLQRFATLHQSPSAVVTGVSALVGELGSSREASGPRFVKTSGSTRLVRMMVGLISGSMANCQSPRARYATARTQPVATLIPWTPSTRLPLPHKPSHQALSHRHLYR